MSNSIKFSHSETGTLDTTVEPVLNNVLILGAVALTYERIDGIPKYATDDEGLKTLIDRSEQMIDHLQSSLSCLGQVLAYTKTDELDLINFGWLIHSLSELSIQIESQKSDMQYVLTENIKKASAK